MNKVEQILDKLQGVYPNAHCELNYNSVFELLVAVILSAQCTDKRVNVVTEKLFKLYNTPSQFAALSVDELKPHIFSCGFYNNKAKSIISASKDIVNLYNGQVPKEREQLETLAGVGRKTANVIYAVGFNGQAIAVDTHVFRVANRLGLASAKTPLEVERQLMAVIDENMHSQAHHLLLFHGRYTCKSQNPQCNDCVVCEFCDYYSQKNKQ